MSEETPKRFATTIRKTKDPHLTSAEDYYDFLRVGLYKSKHHIETLVSFEYKSGIHVHMITDVSQDVKNENHFYKLLKPCKGWNIKVKEVFDDSGWSDYMNKEDPRYYESWLQKRLKNTNLCKYHKWIRKCRYMDVLELCEVQDMDEANAIPLIVEPPKAIKKLISNIILL